MMRQPPFSWRSDVHMTQGTKRKRERKRQKISLLSTLGPETKTKQKTGARAREKFRL